MLSGQTLARCGAYTCILAYRLRKECECRAAGQGRDTESLAWPAQGDPVSWDEG